MDMHLLTPGLLQREHYDKTGQISRTPEEIFAKSFGDGAVCVYGEAMGSVQYQRFYRRLICRKVSEPRWAGRTPNL